MDQSERRALDTLMELGSYPATPFFEGGPAVYVSDTLARLGVPYERDPFGNVIAHYQGSGPPTTAVAFVAHMDHPGFEVTEAGPDGIVAKAMGGVPAAAIAKQTPVLILSPDGARIPATTAPHLDSAAPDDRRGERLVYVRSTVDINLQPPASVVFDLPDFVLDGDVIRMRAADDLAGCAAILAGLERLVETRATANVYGLFTRAEEVGLYGARLLAEAGTLPPDTVVVSIESSSVIPGVAQGAGPVIRTGDAAYTFSANAELILSTARDALRKEVGDFKVQRQLMSGGVCEATAFAAASYSVTGIAFPLGNYHNATTTLVDLDGGVDAENIHLSDYLGGVRLISQAATTAAIPPDWLSRPVPEDIRSRLQDTSS